MRIRDRGKIKWQGALFAPEHRTMLRELARDELRQAKPIIDEYELEEIDRRICYAMEYTLPVVISMWQEGFTYEEKGYVHYSDPLLKEIRIKAEDGSVIRIKIADIVAVEVNE
ncbi:YolD-like family protein [Bacillus sp. ISL-37]|uniref:YolD-like family protein n=1 Tax=Bacillus sp. ISL-37 TaxID=2819123 RepID=UPI001BE6F022|nr:YolD-like family protein [Bacillus sp. ISL-37]MBT2682675.1 YolD-like family protein [Bacillus sp. ISL-37]